MFNRLFFYLVFFISPCILASSPLEIYQKAKKQDPTFKQAYFAHHGVQKNFKIARSALFPQVNVGYGYSKIHQKKSVKQKYSQESSQLSISQPLFNAPAYFYYLEANELKKASIANFEQAQQDLILRSLTSYLNILEAHDIFAAHVSETHEFKERLNEAKAKSKLGAAIQSDVAKASAAYAMSNSKMSSSKTNITKAMDVLSVMTQTRPHHFKKIQSLPSWIHPSRLEKAPINNNPVLRASMLKTKALKIHYHQSLSNHLPIVTGQASWNKTDYDGGSSSLLRPSHLRSASISVKLPIFTGGAVMAHSAREKDLYRQSKYETLQLKRQISRAHQSYPTVLKSLWQSVHAAKKSVQSSKLEVSTVKAHYKQGRSQLSDVLDSIKHQNQNQELYAKALYVYLKEYFNYLALQGKLDDKHLIKINQLFTKPIKLPQGL